MTGHPETELRQRFAALERDGLGADWGDVLARRGAHAHRRRRWPLLAAAAVLAALIVGPSWALRDRIVHRFSAAEPAPTRIQKNFRDLGVLAERTRKVLAVETPDGPLVLWVAPTVRGFCIGVTGQNVCGTSDPAAFDAWPDAFATDGAHVTDEPLIIGYASYDDAAYVELSYEGHAEATAPLHWVSAPIDAGLFVHRVPEEIWADGRVQYVAVVRDAGGTELDRTELEFGVSRRELR